MHLQPQGLVRTLQRLGNKSRQGAACKVVRVVDGVEGGCRVLWWVQEGQCVLQCTCSPKALFARSSTWQRSGQRAACKVVAESEVVDTTTSETKGGWRRLVLCNCIAGLTQGQGNKRTCSFQVVTAMST